MFEIIDAYEKKNAKLRIGMETIFALKDYDKSALRAYHSWLALADFQVPGQVEVCVWVSPKTNRIEAALCHI